MRGAPILDSVGAPLADALRRITSRGLGPALAPTSGQTPGVEKTPFRELSLLRKCGASTGSACHYALPLPPAASCRTLSQSKGAPRIFIPCGAGGTGMDDSESFLEGRRIRVYRLFAALRVTEETGLWADP